MSASEESVDHLNKLIESNKVEEVRGFIEGASGGSSTLCQVGKKGFAPLHNAVFCSHSDIVSYILSKEVNVDLPLPATVRKGVDWYEQGSTALHIACSKRHKDVVVALLSAGASADLVNGGAAQQTPLHVAAEHGHLAHVEQLVLSGASLATADQNGEMPIHKAARNGHSPVLMYLLSNRAEVNLANNDGLTPLMLAVCEGHLKNTLLLLENGADITCTDNERNTSLALAIVNNQEDIIPLLLDNEVDVNAQNCRGDTPLHLACRLSQPGAVDILLDVGVEIDIENSLGHTALHLAAYANDYSIVSQLLSAGAATDLADNEGKLAVECTTSNEVRATITTGVISLPEATQKGQTIPNVEQISTNADRSVSTANEQPLQMAGGIVSSWETEPDPECSDDPGSSVTLQAAAANIAHRNTEVDGLYTEHMTPLAPPNVPQPAETIDAASPRLQHLPHESRTMISKHKYASQQNPTQFQQAIKVDRATVDTLRDKISSLESQILTLGIGDDKAVVLYRQYGKLIEEMNLARQMVREYVLQRRPLTPRMENSNTKSNCSSPMDLPAPRQGASTPRNSKHSNSNTRKFNPNFMVETVESLKSELEILRSKIKPSHSVKLNTYISEVESMALAVVTFAHMMAVTLVL